MHSSGQQQQQLTGLSSMFNSSIQHHVNLAKSTSHMQLVDAAAPDKNAN
jgi:hypothetical protein